MDAEQLIEEELADLTYEELEGGDPGEIAAVENDRDSPRRIMGGWDEVESGEPGPEVTVQPELSRSTREIFD